MTLFAYAISMDTYQLRCNLGRDQDKLNKTSQATTTPHSIAHVQR